MSDIYRVIVEKNGGELIAHEVEIAEEMQDIKISFSHVDDEGTVDRSIAISARFLHWKLAREQNG